MTKLERITEEIEKVRGKIVHYTGKLKTLEEDKVKAENTEILKAVRAHSLSAAELNDFLKSAGLSPPKRPKLKNLQGDKNIKDSNNTEEKYNENHI